MKKVFNSANKREAALAIVFFILFVLIYSVTHAQSGNRFSGFSLQTSLAGSGIGGGLQLTADLESGNSVFSLGPVIQISRGNISGAQFQYRYYINNNLNRRATLFFFGSAQYNRAAFLSNGTIDREKMIFPESGFDYAKMRISAMELYGGFGIKYAHTSFLSSTWNIGTGAYLPTPPKI